MHKDSYAAGGALTAQVNIGEALYSSLVAKQLVKAADHALESQRQDTIFVAAQGYYDLALAQGSVGVAKDALRISRDYEAQINQAVSAGIAFKGDALRVIVQKQRNELALRQARERQRIAAARLSQVLHLDPSVELLAQDSELAPLSLVDTNVSLQTLMREAVSSRPELKQSHALAMAAREEKNGSTYGPLIPSLGAQGFFGGLGGGRSGVPDTFGGEQDYVIGLSWRIGPGGLFDFTRTRAAESRLNTADLSRRKLEDELARQVVEAFTRWHSLADQVQTARSTLETAEQSLNLARQRREFAVGIVLENIQAEEDLTRARLDYLQAVAAFNQAQYALRKSSGQL